MKYSMSECTEGKVENWKNNILKYADVDNYFTMQTKKKAGILAT